MIQLLNFSILPDFHVFFHNANKHSIIRFSVSHMEGSSQRIAHSMNCCAACGSKGKTRKIACCQELVQKLLSCLLSPFCNHLISADNFLNCFVSKQLRIGCRLRKKTGLHRMNQGVNGAGCKETIGQSLQQLRNQTQLFFLYRLSFVFIKLRNWRTVLTKGGGIFLRKSRLKNPYYLILFKPCGFYSASATASISTSATSACSGAACRAFMLRLIL